MIVSSWLYPVFMILALSALAAINAFQVHPQPHLRCHTTASVATRKNFYYTVSKTAAIRNSASIICKEGNFNIDERLDNPRSTPLDKPVLAVTDLLSLVLFAGIGKASHSADGSLDVPAVLQTAGPFLLAWFGTSPLTGVYRDSKDSGNDGILDVGLQVAKGWIVAIPLGCILRGVVKGYVPPLPFVVVTMISTLIILGGSRILYSVVESKFEQSSE